MKGKTEHNWLHGGYVAIPAHEALPLVARPWMRLSTNCRVPPSSKRVTSQWKPLATPWGGQLPSSDTRTCVCVSTRQHAKVLPPNAHQDAVTRGSGQLAMPLQLGGNAGIGSAPGSQGGGRCMENRVYNLS